MSTLFKQLHQSIEMIHHLLSAMIPDDLQHIEFGMSLQFIEFPRIEVGDEITFMVKYAMHHPVA